MQAIILKSEPCTRFRFGEALGAITEETHNSQKSTSDYLHSDTLWSALVNAWVIACPDSLNDFLKACNEDKFKLSSAFYYVEYNNKQVYFFPKPASLNLFQVDDPKKVKKVRFLSKGVWEQGLLPDKWFDGTLCTLLQNGSIVALTTEIDQQLELFKTETMPHTRARDVSDREDAFYYQTDLYLLSGENYQTDWYCLVKDELPINLHNDLQKAMTALVNFGVGGERTSGCGGLTSFGTYDIVFGFVDQAGSGNYNASVSLIAPRENELTEDSLYQVIKRGGRFLAKGKALPMIQMLLEGAVFNTEVRGRIVKLNDNPPILRYGLNLTIPLHPSFIHESL